MMIYNAYDQLLSDKLLLPNEAVNGYICGTVIKPLKNNLGQAAGARHLDPNLDSIIFINSQDI